MHLGLLGKPYIGREQAAALTRQAITRRALFGEADPVDQDPFDEVLPHVSRDSASYDSACVPWL